MDKTEYQIKLDQITTLVEKQDYEGALEIVETIDWRRVKSVRTLCMVADIFEVNDMLEDSKKILLLAYKRSSIGKVILYRLVEISLKMGDVDDAVEFYTEYAQNAPGDNSKYILKYKIYKAKRSPIEDQIAILEEYKSKEYTERWAYELACLYSKAGMKDKCVEECDDLILWFSEGIYVTKAMELKMEYQPLTPSQQEKYDNRDKDEEVVTELQEKKDALQQQTEAVLEKLEEAREEAIEGNRKAEQAAAEAAVTLDKAEAKPFVIEPEKLKEKLASSLKDVLSGIYKGKEEVKMEYSSEDDDLESARYDSIDPQSVKELEPENLGETTVVPSEELDKIKNVQPENSEEEEKGEEKPEQQPEENQEDLIQKLLEETANRLAQQISSGNYIGKEKQIEKILDEDIFGDQTEDSDKEAAVKESAQEIIEEPVAEESAEEVIEESAVEEPVEEIKEEPAAEEPVQEITEEPALEEPAQEITEEPVPEEPAEEIKEESAVEEPEGEIVQERSLEDSIIAMALEETQAREETSVGDTREFGAEELSEIEDAAEKSEEIPETEQELSLEEKILAEETPEERRSRILNDVHSEKLTDDQRKLFSYFTKVPGMDQQILEALKGVYQNAGERTSKNGNIAVMGNVGSGKTKLTDSLVRAICCDLGLEATKEARITGEALNEKDPAQVVSKLAGGFLLIEHAGQMSSETVDKLSRALEFRTDRLILIIEDEKKRMRKLLADHPEFAEKFATVISIPVFTNDELVTFARTYARETGYKIDELGILALYTRIGEQQTEEEPMTVATVKVLVDKAILKAHRGKLDKKVSKKRLDDDGRIILFEKDFDF
ncbi:MAG: tetratricopeptide repeat protein [Ruminococcus sp.]